MVGAIRSVAGTLVDELVEGMLAVCTQCAPDYWLSKEDVSSNIKSRGSLFGDEFTVGFHVSLNMNG